MAFLATNIFPGDGATTYWDFAFAGVSPDSASGTLPYLYAEDVRALELYKDSEGNAAAAERVVYIDPALPLRANIVGLPVASGRQIKIYRSTEIRFPLVDYRDRQTVSEFDLDLANRQAIFVAQETQDGARSNLALDKNENYDASNRRIVNVAPGIDPGDAVNVGQLANSLGRTLRAPDTDPVVVPLPAVSQRANRLLSFDASGNPRATLPETGSALDLAIDLADNVNPLKGASLIGYDGATVAAYLARLANGDDAPDGAAMIGYNGQSLAQYLSQSSADLANALDPLKGVTLVGGSARTVSSVAAVAALPVTGTLTALAEGYYVPGDNGGGVYRYVAASAATVDWGRVLPSVTGVGRWLLCQSSPATLRQYGAKGDNVTDDTTAYLRAVNSQLPLAVTAGRYRVAPIGPPVSYPGGREPNRTSGAVLVSGQNITGVGAGAVEFIWSSTVTVQAFFKVANASHVTISGIKFTGGYAALCVDPTTNGSVDNVGLQNCILDGQLIGLLGGRQYALDAAGSRYSQNIWMDHCVVRNTVVHGVMITNSYRPRVTNCEFGNLMGGFAVDFSQGCRGGIVANNVGVGLKYFFKAESSHVDLNGNPLDAPVADTQSHTIVVSGNVATDIQEYAVFLNSGVQRFSIAGNNFSGSFTRCITFGQVTASAGPGLSSITGNVITQASVNAIAFFSQSSTGTEPILIQGNEVTGGSVGLTWETGRLRFLNNNINVLDNAINLNALADGVDIVGNFLKGTAGIVTNNTGIWKRVCINDNRIHVTTGFAVYLATLDGFHNSEFFNNKVFRTSVVANPSVAIRKAVGSRFQNNSFNLATGSGQAMQLYTSTLGCSVLGNISTSAFVVEGADATTTSNTANNITNAAYVA